MPWIETSPGRWERPIGENEAMIKTIGDEGQQFGKDVWSISVVASLGVSQEDQGVSTLSQMLVNGWRALRFLHPSIASFIGKEDTVVYHVPDPVTLEQWVAESFICVEGDDSVNDVLGRLSPRPYTSLYYLKKRGTIVLHLSHWRTDGIGAMHLLNAYVQCIVGQKSDPLHLPWGNEVNRLVPSVEEALSLPPKPSRAIESAATQYLGTLANLSGALGAPFKRGDGVVRGGTRHANLRLSPEETTELDASCYERGIRIEAALHASVAAAACSITQSQPHNKERHYTSTLRQSLRLHLPPPLDGTAGAAGLYTAGYLVKVSPSQSWLENAKQYDAEYRKGATPELLSSRRQYAVVMKEILQNRKTSPSPQDPPPSGLDISWIPNVPHLVQSVHTGAAGSLRIRRVSIGVEVASRHLYIFGWIFDGQLELNLVYNEGYYDELLAQNILAVTRQHLLSNLLSASKPGDHAKLATGGCA